MIMKINVFHIYCTKKKLFANNDGSTLFILNHLSVCISVAVPLFLHVQSSTARWHWLHDFSQLIDLNKLIAISIAKLFEEYFIEILFMENQII